LGKKINGFEQHRSGLRMHWEKSLAPSQSARKDTGFSGGKGNNQAKRKNAHVSPNSGDKGGRHEQDQVVRRHKMVLGGGGGLMRQPNPAQKRAEKKEKFNFVSECGIMKKKEPEFKKKKGTGCSYLEGGFQGNEVIINESGRDRVWPGDFKTQNNQQNLAIKHHN